MKKRRKKITINHLFDKMNFNEAFFKFYPAEYLESDLLNPELVEKADSIFQDAVAGLLSLIGYSVIVLGKKKRNNRELDKLRFESKVVLGSVDLIAFREDDKLFLAECTIDIVDDTKIRLLQKMVNNLVSEEDRKYSKGMGLIFSSQDCRDIRRRYHEDIRIMDSHKLKIIFDLMMKGKNKDARLELLS